MPERAQEDTRLLAGVECTPRAELETIQGCLLAQAVRRARRAPFFRARIAGLGEAASVSPAAFQRHVPLTSKDDLRAAGPTAWATEDVEPASMLLATSGTTGTRVVLPYTWEDRQTWFRLVARTLWTNGLRPEDVVLLPVPLGLFTGGQGMFGGLQRLGCTVIPTGPLHTEQLAGLLQGDLGVTPTAIVTLPSHMLRLLDALPALGYDPAASPLRLGSFGAEAWTEEARARIETGFGLRAMDSYGIGELCGPGIAAECEVRQGMHVWEDAFFVEIIDPATGQPLCDGETGELVLTNLFREAFPLLRFRTGDAAAIIAGPCPCGRTHRRITRVARRIDDVLVVNGVNVYPADIEAIVLQQERLSNEFYLETVNGELIVHVEAQAGCALAGDAVTDAIRRVYPVRVAVRVHAPGELERLPGKARRIRT